MANIKSAEKRARQAKVRRLRNISTRSAIKTAIRRFEAALTAGDMTAARAALRRTTILLDKAAAKGIIHKNKAARKKSRLAKRLAAVETAS
ncbi:MAG TPA: 30S ribosomal protein S20 [Firmicutes bacterium]|nr:30S ribosomal protein S20 [Bacillota bacterium]